MPPSPDPAAPWITAQTWTQPGDDAQPNPRDHPQELRVRIEDAGAGAYAVLSTRRWAVDKDDLAQLFERLAALIDQHDKGMGQLD